MKIIIKDKNNQKTNLVLIKDLGMQFATEKSKWISVVYNIKRIYLGSFSNAIDGALAYDKYIIENNLEHTLNFKKEL